MNRDWQDFKALYGNIEGAREGFERACETLFKKVYSPRYVSQMAVSRGDGGIDIFVGGYSVEPIIVIQCKFFLEDFGNSQKQQIKKSFQKAIGNKDYELSEWILCIPKVFNQKDNEWWFNWKKNQKVNIRLINGNELIDLMKEHDVYNQIFQMEDSIRLKEIYDVIVPKKREISSLSNDKSFLDEVFRHIQREEHIKLFSMTSTPYHNKVAKYYKDKIYNMAVEYYSKTSVFSIHPPTNREINQLKYFSKLAKQCGFDENISDGDEFVEALSQQLESKDIFLLISEFENGSDKYRKELAFALRPLLSDSMEYSCTIAIFGRKRLMELSLEENEYGLSPLNYFEELLIPTPTIEDYKQIIGIEDNISQQYHLTGGHPELMKLCLRRKSEDYKALILSSNYGDKFFRKYQHRRDRVLRLFEKESFGQFSLWSHDELLRDLFWDNLIVEDGNNRFKWIAPIVAELGKRYFR